MIPVPSGVRVWLAVGQTDMRRGMNGLALQVSTGRGISSLWGAQFSPLGGGGDQPFE